MKNKVTLKSVLTDYAKGTKSILDVGCGDKNFSYVGGSAVTVDAWENVKPDFLLDLEKEDLPFEENSFDCVFLMDFIEHIPYERGKVILEQAQKIARERIYLLTPLVFDSNEQHANNPRCWAYGNHYYNSHKSLWKKSDFLPELGWTEITNTTHLFFQPTYFGYWSKK